MLYAIPWYLMFYAIPWYLMLYAIPWYLMLYAIPWYLMLYAIPWYLMLYAIPWYLMLYAYVRLLGDCLLGISVIPHALCHRAWGITEYYRFLVYKRGSAIQKSMSMAGLRPAIIIARHSQYPGMQLPRI